MKKQIGDCSNLSVFEVFVTMPVCMIFQLLVYVVQFCIWYLASWINVIRRVLDGSFMNSVDSYKYKPNVVTIGGIFSPVFSNIGKMFSSRLENTWSPRMGAVSCVKDRACEAIYDMIGEKKVNYIEKLNHSSSKAFVEDQGILSCFVEKLLRMFSCKKAEDAPGRPDFKNKIKILCYSAGVSTFNQMLIYMHENNIGYIIEKINKKASLTCREKEIYHKITDAKNKRYKCHFPCIKQDGNNENIHLSPDMFEKIVFISPPFTGVEWISEGLNLEENTQKYCTYSITWLVSLFLCVYYKLVGDTEGYLISPYLGQYSENFCEFINNGRNLVQDLADVKTLEKDSVEAMKIMEMYGLKHIRVITNACTEVGNNYYFKPDSEPNIYLYWLFGSRLFKKKHDGVISLESQTFGLKCSCLEEQCFDSLYKCNKCGTIVCPVDHASIVFRNGCLETRERAWKHINLFLGE